MAQPSIETRAINTVRFLSVDAVQRANSGHPGAPMGMADIAEVLWRDYVKHNPANPGWADRDRFVLSNGHASMLLYSLLPCPASWAITRQGIRNTRRGDRSRRPPDLWDRA